MLRFLHWFLGRVGDRLVLHAQEILLHSEEPLPQPLVDELGHVSSRGFVPGLDPIQLLRLGNGDR